ncbi:MAG: hypothetical protein Q9218_008121, partial [Villophora microphyllina]
MAVTPANMDTILTSLRAGSNVDDDDIARKTNKMIMEQETVEKQLEMAESLLHRGSMESSFLDVVIYEAWTTLWNEKLWKGKYSTETEAKRFLTTASLADILKKALSGRDRKSKAVQEIMRNWRGIGERRQWAELGENLLKEAASLSVRYTYREVVHLCRAQVLKRLQEPGKGRGLTRTVTRADLVRLNDSSTEDLDHVLESATIPDQTLEDMEIGNHMLLASAIVPAADHPKAGRKRYKGALGAPSALSADESMEDEEEHSDKDRGAVIGDEDRGAVIGDKDRGAVVDGEEQRNEESDEEDSDDEDEHDSEAGDVTMGGAEGSEEEEGPTDSPDDSFQKKRRRKRKKNRCSCYKSSRVDPYLLTKLSRRSAKAADMTTPEDCFGVVASLLYRQKLDHVCFIHLKHLCRHLGLNTTVKREVLIQRVMVCYKQKQPLEELKSGRATYSWFQVLKRPVCDDDKQSIFRFKVDSSSSVVYPANTLREAIIQELAGVDAVEKWTTDGNLFAVGLFNWLWTGLGGESGIGPLIDIEFEMYQHHLRERNGRPNMGWGRSMYYSLTQMLVRQDLSYWLLYACLRPDQNHRLVAYPYYVKYATPGDKTSFRHIDMSVPKYLETGRGGNIIQGALSLDDEDAKNCTELVPGFHRHLKTWWEALGSREPVPDGLVHDVAGRFSKEDAERFGSFVPLPCKRGTVRVTRPEIIHGSTAGGTKPRRRLILP